MSKFDTNTPLAVVDTGKKFYRSTPAGPGSWATLRGLGVLWTDNRDALQLGFLAGADDDSATEIRLQLVEYCTLGWSATDAFDSVLADNGNPAVVTGDLADLPH